MAIDYPINDYDFVHKYFKVVRDKYKAEVCFIVHSPQSPDDSSKFSLYTFRSVGITLQAMQILSTPPIMMYECLDKSRLLKYADDLVFRKKTLSICKIKIEHLWVKKIITTPLIGLILEN